MKTIKLMMMTLIMCLCFNSFSQWKYNLEDNGFDKPYKSVNCISKDKTIDNIAGLALVDIETSINYDSLLISYDTIIQKLNDSTIINIIPKYSYKTKQIIIYEFALIVPNNDWNDNVILDLSYNVNGIYKKYHYTTYVENTSEYNTIIISYNLLTSEMLSDFKSASVLKIRVKSDNYPYEKIYEFNMANSTNALNFIQK